MRISSGRMRQTCHNGCSQGRRGAEGPRSKPCSSSHGPCREKPRHRRTRRPRYHQQPSSSARARCRQRCRYPILPRPMSRSCGARYPSYASSLRCLRRSRTLSRASPRTSYQAAFQGRHCIHGIGGSALPSHLSQERKRARHGRPPAR